MINVFRQIAPCRFTTSEYSDSPLIYNFTEHFKRIISNEVWNRSYDYGYSESLKLLKADEFKSIRVTIYPKRLSGYIDHNRHKVYIREHCGEIDESFLSINTTEFDDHTGLIVLEIELSDELDGMINTGDPFSSEIIGEYHKLNAVLKETSAFLLSGLNLLFPTNSLLMDDEDPISDGFIQIKSQGKEYLQKYKSAKFTHQILIDDQKREDLDFVFDMLSKTWHKNLWPLRRYLIAVESSKVTMDNLLDLTYALEGMFKKNTSSDFIKLIVCVQFSSNKEQAVKMKSFLDNVFRLRNEMVHGGKTFSQIDPVKINGKEILASKLYWEMKGIIATLIVRALPKLVNNIDQMSISYTANDIWDKIYRS